MGGPETPTPDGPRPRWSKDADKYLLPHEKPPVIATRRHWAVLVVPMAKALPVLAVGFWLMVLDPENRVTASVGLILLVGALGYLALRAGEWWMRHFIVTNRRVLLTTGIIVRTVALLPLRRITDLTYKETLLGQLLGYGTFRFESAGQQHEQHHGHEHLAHDDRPVPPEADHPTLGGQDVLVDLPGCQHVGPPT